VLLSTARQLAQWEEMMLTPELEAALGAISRATVQRLLHCFRQDTPKLPRRTPQPPNRLLGGLGSICRLCSAFGVCTKNRYKGRELLIGPHEPILLKHRAWMATKEAKIAYKRRKEISEPSFGIIKEQMSFRRFLLRGLNNVKAEVIMAATAFNMRICIEYGVGKQVR
jgi:hypothetical protein